MNLAARVWCWVIGMYLMAWTLVHADWGGEWVWFSDDPHGVIILGVAVLLLLRPEKPDA